MNLVNWIMRFEMSFRAIRLEIEHKKYQAFIRNLDRDMFPMELIKDISDKTVSLIGNLNIKGFNYSMT